MEQLESVPFSRTWFSTFMDAIPAAQTAAEVAFLKRWLPLAHHPTVLDLCCGSGRHTNALARDGYAVTGVDRDRAALARARSATAPGAMFVRADVRDAVRAGGEWSAVIIMWASFGWFAPERNRELLDHIRTCLGPRGRLVLDVYNRDFFALHEGERRRERNGIHITESKWLSGDRLTVKLRYDGSADVDRFTWQVFTPPELAAELTRIGFRVVVHCAEFDENVAPDAGRPRMQVVAERSGSAA